MKSIILMTCFISMAVQADVVQDDVTINGVRYEKELLNENLDFPICMVVDYQTNDLYFNYEENGTTFFSAQLNLNTKDLIGIVCTQDSIGAAIDSNTHDVYLGGHHGIYKYNKTTNEVNQVVTIDENTWIWSMFFKNILYFLKFPSNHLYTFVNGQSARFADVPYEVHTFVIDNDDFMYFSYFSHFYRQKKGTNVRVEIKDVPYVTALNTDKNGNVYACSTDGIYKAIGHSGQFTKVVDVIDPKGIVFDRDNNMIYSEYRKIIRLKPKGV